MLGDDDDLNESIEGRAGGLIDCGIVASVVASLFHLLREEAEEVALKPSVPAKFVRPAKYVPEREEEECARCLVV